MFSDMALFTSPPASGGDFIEDITWACWPTYRRVSVDLGGDFEATFTVSGVSDSVLETWFQNYLGAYFAESLGGEEAFVGRFERMVLKYHGRVLSRDLGEVRNAVRVRYQTDSGSAETVTSEATDADSIDKYGTRQLVAKPDVFLNATSAAQYRDNLLARLKEPRTKAERVKLQRDQPGQLQVTVRGYVHSLSTKLIKSTSTVDDDASDEVTEAISGADFVTAGNIESNTLQVVEEADYEPAWKRIKAIAELGDDSGGRWRAGCYQSRALDYVAADVDNIFYRVRFKQGRRVADIVDATGADVPLALVRPGVIAFSEDILPARAQATTLLDDPRATYVAKVTYDRNGVVLDGDNPDIRRAALQMALQATS